MFSNIRMPNVPHNGVTYLKLFTLPVTALLWYLFYKSRKVDDENLYILDPLDRRDGTKSAEGFKVVRMKVPNRAVGAIIGKQGSTIKRIQESTRTTINFVDRTVNGDVGVSLTKEWAELADGDTTAEVMSPPEELCIRGLASRVAAAEREILTIIASVPPLISEDMQVEQKHMGRIIGRNGENIRQLRAQFRVRINIDRNASVSGRDGPTSTAKTYNRVNLKGTKDQVEATKAAIICTIMENEELLRAHSTSNGAGAGVKKVTSMPISQQSMPISQQSMPISQQSTPSYMIVDDNVDSFRSSSVISESQGSLSYNRKAPLPLDSDITTDFRSDNGSPVKVGPMSTVSTPSLALTDANGLEPRPVQHTNVIFPEDRLLWHRIMISSVSSCTDFYAHVVAPESTLLEPLVQNMSAYFNDNSAVVDACELFVDQIVAAYYVQDGSWQRARIVSLRVKGTDDDEVSAMSEVTGTCTESVQVSEKPSVTNTSLADASGVSTTWTGSHGNWEVEVDYVDYGDFSVLDISQVRPLVQPEFLDLPFQAVRLKLFGIQPVGGVSSVWPEEAISCFENLTMAGDWQVLHARHATPTESDSTIPTIELEDRTKTGAPVNIAAALVAQGHAEWIPGAK